MIIISFIYFKTSCIVVKSNIYFSEKSCSFNTIYSVLKSNPEQVNVGSLVDSGVGVEEPRADFFRDEDGCYAIESCYRCGAAIMRGGGIYEEHLRLILIGND